MINMRKLRFCLLATGILIIVFKTWIFETLINLSSIRENAMVSVSRVSSLSENETTLKTIDLSSEVDCDKLFLGNTMEQIKAEKLSNKHVEVLNNTFVHFKNLNCSAYISMAKYILHEISDEELEFPLAFSIMVHKDAIQFEKLLRIIYRPQNYYCVHIDLKTKKEEFKIIEKLCNCFDNVFLSSKRNNVEWGRFSQLEADLICLNNLLERSRKWKYLLNVAGQEFPLRTNWELVKIFKSFRGKNSIEGVYHLQNFRRNPPGSPPFNIKWIKGSFRIAASREFVEFATQNSKALSILSLLRENDISKRSHPDEKYYSTLNYNKRVLGTPGGMSVLPEDNFGSMPCLVRFVNWRDYPCHSKRKVRGVCIWGVKDLPFIVVQPHLFVNKFYWNFEPYALSCLHETIYHRAIRDFYAGQTSLDLKYYAAYATYGG